MRIGRPRTLFAVLFLIVSSQDIDSSQIADEPFAYLRSREFPQMDSYEPRLPAPIRTYFVSAYAPTPGDGTTRQTAWSDLQPALCRLEPGDRLVVLPGAYAGHFEMTEGEGCSNGTGSKPIQVVAEPGARIRGGLQLQRSHWQFVAVEITPGDEPDLPAFYIVGTGILVDRAHLHHGMVDGIILAGGSRDVTISNTHIHDFRRVDRDGQPLDAHGVVVWPGAVDVLIVQNHIHDNSGDGVQIYGPGDGSLKPERYARNVRIIGNRIHDDVENAVDVKDSRNVTIRDNKMWGYPPAPDTDGDAIVIHYDSEDVIVENNYIAESNGMVVGRGNVSRALGGGPAAREPRNILVLRNYFENKLETKGVALTVLDGRCVKFYHNVVHNYRGGISQRSKASGSSGEIYAANNVFIDVALLGFWVTSDFADVFRLFDYNAFGLRSSQVRVQVGGREVGQTGLVADLSEHVGSGRMFPHTVVVGSLSIKNNDLAEIAGIDTIDRGVPVPGGTTCTDSEVPLPFRGALPDLGAYESDEWPEPEG